jgi:hypothetical protein
MERYQDLTEISVDAHSDDYRIEAAIDGRPYLMKASVEQIKALAETGWGGSYEADEIYIAAKEAGCEEALKLEQYLASKPVMVNNDPVGYEVQLDEYEAMAWLEVNRPEIYRELSEELDLPDP